MDMTPEPFTLDGNGGPAFKSPDAAAFRPHSKAAMNRQAIHSVLQKDLDAEHSLDELVTAAGMPRKQVYAAAKQLCRKGFAERKDAIEVAINVGGKSVNKRVIKVKGRDLMDSKIKHGLW